MLYLGLCGLTACVNVETYEKVQDSEVLDVYVSPDADFGKYRKLMFQPLEIAYVDDALAPDPGQHERLRGIFRDAFLDALDDQYEIVDKRGRDVLEVHASLLDLKLRHSNEAVELPGKLRRLSAAGKLTFLIELKDSASSRTLLRAGDIEQENDTPGETDEWLDSEAAAKRWAKLFREFLDEYLNKST